MNYKVVRYVLGIVLGFEALFLLLPCIVSAIYREHEGLSFFTVALVLGLLCFLLTRRKPENKVYYAKEGMLIVAFSWILLSIGGAVPFVLNGEIPRFEDALFETISGFTTTGASILTNVDAMSKCSLFWRSFTHWVGGMGVIVFIIAIMPMTGGYNMHLMRAESPGPSVGKLVPKARQSAMILYKIYMVMTLAQVVLLCLAGMPLFDSLTISFGSAGTGGFAVRSSGMGDYTLLMQAIITVFIILFGVNFNFYYYLLGKHKKDAFKMTEVRWYVGIIAAAVLLIAFNVREYFGSFFLSFHHAAFQVASIMTTTGFATVDFNLWPNFSKCILVLLMFIGACAGSTGGGLKVSRLVILLKGIKQDVVRIIHPRGVTTVKMDGKGVAKEMVQGVSIYLAAYVIMFAASVLLICLFEGEDLVTNFTAVAATFNNIGPGLAGVGPMSSYFNMSVPSKCILMFDMLAGRLELYPVLILLFPETWKRK